jgi:hypothetical protein
MFSYPNGLGATQSVALGTDADLYSAQRVLYVDSTDGDDGNDGTDRGSPLKTLGAAITASAAGGTIFLMDGFVEELGATTTLTNNVAVVTEGLSSGEPTAEIGFDASGELVLGPGCSIHNVLFSGRSADGSSARVQVPNTAHGARFFGCLFESDDNEDEVGLEVADATNGVTIWACIFRSVADTTKPAAGLGFQGEYGTIAQCVFDAGSLGYDDLAADLSQSATTGLLGWGNTSKNGAWVKLHASTGGLFQLSVSTGAGGVQF